MLGYHRTVICKHNLIRFFICTSKLRSPLLVGCEYERKWTQWRKFQCYDHNVKVTLWPCSCGELSGHSRFGVGGCHTAVGEGNQALYLNRIVADRTPQSFEGSLCVMLLHMLEKGTTYVIWGSAVMPAGTSSNSGVVTGIWVCFFTSWSNVYLSCGMQTSNYAIAVYSSDQAMAVVLDYFYCFYLLVVKSSFLEFGSFSGADRLSDSSRVVVESWCWAIVESKLLVSGPLCSIP